MDRLATVPEQFKRALRAWNETNYHTLNLFPIYSDCCFITRNSSTCRGKTPAEIVFGRQLRASCSLHVQPRRARVLYQPTSERSHPPLSNTVMNRGRNNSGLRIWNPANSDDAVHAYSILALDGRGRDRHGHHQPDYPGCERLSAQAGGALLAHCAGLGALRHCAAAQPDVRHRPEIRIAANSAFTTTSLSALQSPGPGSISDGVCPLGGLSSACLPTSPTRPEARWSRPQVTVTVVPAAGPSSLSSATDVVLFYNATQYKAGLPLDLGRRPHRVQTMTITWDRPLLQLGERRHA
uniref:Uncharacterized protein n=1 Tax=Macrostomum lignano TaxID=282301 RepID=A0A1I8FJK6_9PLAT